jgi:hypothetical protein
MQHAPEHGLGVQTVPMPRKECPAPQAAWQVLVQVVAALSQHAPEAHGFGVHVTPTPM